MSSLLGTVASKWKDTFVRQPNVFYKVLILMNLYHESGKLKMRRQRKNWLVTGCAGIIGAHLTEALLKLDQKVVGLDNFANNKLDMRVHTNTVDSYLINQSQAVLSNSECKIRKFTRSNAPELSFFNIKKEASINYRIIKK